MTDKPGEGSGSSLSFENVRNLGRSEHAKPPGESDEDHAANLAFEAAPRAPSVSRPPAAGSFGTVSYTHQPSWPAPGEGRPSVE